MNQDQSLPQSPPPPEGTPLLRRSRSAARVARRTPSTHRCGGGSGSDLEPGSRPGHPRRHAGHSEDSPRDVRSGRPRVPGDRGRPRHRPVGHEDAHQARARNIPQDVRTTRRGLRKERGTAPFSNASIANKSTSIATAGERDELVRARWTCPLSAARTTSSFLLDRFQSDMTVPSPLDRVTTREQGPCHSIPGPRT